VGFTDGLQKQLFLTPLKQTLFLYRVDHSEVAKHPFDTDLHFTDILGSERIIIILWQLQDMPQLLEMSLELATSSTCKNKVHATFYFKNVADGTFHTSSNYDAEDW
jgi:hypothetical protein